MDRGIETESTLLKAGNKNLARLFVPGFEGGIEALRWRVKLVDHEGLYPADKIIPAAQAAQEKKLDPHVLAEMIASARSADFVLDEIEVATLIVAKWLLEAEILPRDQLLRISSEARWHLRFLEEEGLESFLKHARPRYRKYGQSLLSHDVLRIRAKVAFQEIVAMLAPDEMVPFLVALSPKYLGCELVQRWIRRQQARALSVDRQVRLEAKKRLQQLFDAIGGDGRKTKRASADSR